MSDPITQPFETLGNAYEQAANTMVDGSISNLISTLTPVITSGLILYIVITGYMVVAGRIQDPISDILIKLSKWTIIGFIALNAATITSAFIGGFNGLEQTILQGFNASNGNAYQSLDNSLSNGLNAAADILDLNKKLDWYEFGAIFRNMLTAGLVMIAVLLQTALAGATIILAKAALLVVFALAPLCLCGLFFPQTSKFADAWFNQAFNFTLAVVITIFFQSISVTVFETQINDFVELGKSGQLDSIPFNAVGKLLIIAIINSFAIKQAPSIASGLSGGVASATASLTGAARNMVDIGRGVGAVGGSIKRGSGRMANEAKRQISAYRQARTSRALNKIKQSSAKSGNSYAGASKYNTKMKF